MSDEINQSAISPAKEADNDFDVDGNINTEQENNSPTRSNILIETLNKHEGRLCKICGSQAEKPDRKKGNVDVLSCNKCGELIHFHCSRLPSYMLHNLSTTSKKYACEICANTPNSFLMSVKSIHENVENDSDDNRYKRLEEKIDQLTEIVEKYNIPCVADKIQMVHSEFNTLDNNCREYIGRINKAMDFLEKELIHNENKKVNSEIEERLCERVKELITIKSSESLLFDTIKEKENLILELTSCKEKHIKKINEMNTNMQTWKQQLDRYADVEMKMNDVNRENVRLDNLVSHLKTKCSEREIQLDRQCISQQTDIRGKQDMINLLTSQLVEAHETRRTLEGNLSAALRTRSPTNQLQPENPILATPLTKFKDNIPITIREPNLITTSIESNYITEEVDGTQKVIIFHDSLCRNVNESLMGREDVTVSKVWAPTLMDTQKKVDEVGKVDTIVVQALTRDLAEKSAEEMTSLTYDTVEKCLLKSETVIVSLVVNREDDDTTQAKLGIVNANIRYNYLKNPKVLICHHDNLTDGRYRKRDKLHLTENGTSRLANNLKFKIAESLGITVFNKRRDNQRYDERNDRSRNRYDNRWYQANENNYNERRQYNSYNRYNNGM